LINYPHFHHRIEWILDIMLKDYSQ
jgi:hypothetical protein